MAVVKPSGKNGLIAAIVGAIGVLAALVANIKTIVEFVEPLFGKHTVPVHKIVRVCMGNGGGDNCFSGSGAHYDCDAYKAIGGVVQGRSMFSLTDSAGIPKMEFGRFIHTTSLCTKITAAVSVVGQDSRSPATSREHGRKRNFMKLLG